jgi:drug/metabolite transporter (DMT)-like permease
MAVFGKLSGSPPVTVALWMNVVAGVAYLPFLLRAVPALRDWPLVAVIGVCGGALAPALFLLGLARTSSVAAALLTTMEAVFTLLLAYGLGERTTRRGYGVIAAMLVLAAVVVTDLDVTAVLAGAALGNLLVLASTVFWSVDNNVSRVLSARNAIPALVSAKCLLATAVLAVAATATQSPLLPVPDDVPLLAFLGVAVHGGAICLFYVGLREIGAMRTGALFTVSAVVGAVGGYLAFTTPVSAVQLAAGAGMVLLAVALARQGGAVPVPRNENARTP